MKFIKIIFSFLIVGVLIMTSKADSLPDMHFIVSGTLNGTAAFASLEYLKENEKYLYFTFDFGFHSISVPDNKDVAYFLISSEIDLENENTSKEKITYGFSEKSWTNINEKDLKGISWENLKLIHKEKPYSDINYYFKAERQNEKVKTLLLKIPTNGNKEGTITIENILNLIKFN